MVAVVLFFELFVFGTWTQQTTGDPYFKEYYSEFKKTPAPRYNYNFSPPVSMYHALLIALESGGWNATSLENMKISVGLDYCAFGPYNSFMQIHQVTSPPVDWSPKQVNDTTYRYVWTTLVYSPPIHSLPPGWYYWVDAATAELLTVPVL